MAVHVLAQVQLGYQSGLPSDVSVNTWSFDIADDTEGELAQVGAFLTTFYQGLDGFWSPALDTAAVSAKIYRRSDPQPRTPIGELVAGTPLISLGDGRMPEEVAACFSFRGAYESGEPPARRRGRVYLGPLATECLNSGDAAGRCYIDSTFTEAVEDAYTAAWAELTTAGNVHEVWSSADDAGYPVVAGWVDNAFDTQRRRGSIATARRSFSGPF